MVKTDREMIAKIIANDPDTDMIVDIEGLKVICGNHVFNVEMKDSAREAFLAASYDPLDTLLVAKSAVEETAKRLGYA
jgi:hypothetical protein